MAELCEVCFVMIKEHDKCVHQGDNGENIYLCNECSEKVWAVYGVSDNLSFKKAVEKIKTKLKR